MQLTDSRPHDASAALRVIATVALAAVLVWMLWYPLRTASAYLDDYLFLTVGTHIKSPSTLLFMDSTGSFFFRPLVMYLWAISVRALGNSASTQLALNIVLHAANAMLLYGLARTWHISRAPAALAALLFGVHPTTFSAAAWLSDRFDLCALLFGLVSLIALRLFLQTRNTGMLAAAAIALFAALMSKEIAYAFVVVACGLTWWSRQNGAFAASAAERRRCMMLLLGCSLVALAARIIVLRDVAEPMLLKHGFAATALGGIANWTRHLSTAFGPHRGSPAELAMQVPLLMLTIAAVLSPRVWREARNAGIFSCFITGFALCAACAVVQAPVMNFFPTAPPQPDGFSFNTLAGSRFYYVSFAGVSLVIAALGEAARRAYRPTGAKAVAVMCVGILAACALLAVSRNVARDWAALTDQNARLVRAAVTAVESVSPPPGCKIYLLGTKPSESAFRVLVDTAVKEALPPGDPHLGCFIQSEHTPWYHVIDATASVHARPSPLRQMILAGKLFPPLQISNLTYYYLRAVDTQRIISDPAARFFALDGERFVDVTQAVRSGSRPVRFYDNRPAY